MKNEHIILELNKVREDIEIKIFIGYQSRNQCINQVSEGTHMTKEQLKDNNVKF